MKWIPPIPCGALYSAPARKLGSALPLLGWCYDNVTTGGWLDLNLQEIAGELDTPYRTIKLWWQALRTSDFIADVQDRGRRGLRARMSGDWLDWRILEARIIKNGAESCPITEINEPEMGQDIALEVVNEPEMGDKWAGNGAENGPSNSMYKVLHDSHESPTPTSLKPDATNGHKPTPNREMVMMLMAKGIQSQKVANEIASKNLDYVTVEQSIDNQLASGAGIGAIVKWLQDNPPEPGSPYPRAPIRPRNPGERVAQTVGIARPPPAPADAVPAREAAKNMLALRNQQRGVRPDDPS